MNFKTWFYNFIYFFLFLRLGPGSLLDLGLDLVSNLTVLPTSLSSSEYTTEFLQVTIGDTDKDESDETTTFRWMSTIISLGLKSKQKNRISLRSFVFEG